MHGQISNRLWGATPEANSGQIPLAVKLSIIMPVKNAKTTIITCLQNLQGAKTAHEIIVVNDHSSDSSMQGVAAYADKIIHLTGTTGPGAARNAGVEHAAGETLLFIDADIYTSGSDIDKSYEEFIHSGSVCAVAGYRDNPNLAFVARNYNFYMMHKYAGKGTTTVFFTSYAMIRKERFLPFCETMMSLEDAEVGQRLVTSGVQIRLFKSITVLHLKQIGLVGLARQFWARSHNAVLLSWVCRREQRTMHDDSVKFGTKLSLLLAPAIPLLLPFPLVALALAVLFMVANRDYFTYILRHEGVVRTTLHILLYGFTIIFADLGIASGIGKIARHEFLAPPKIRKTSLP